MNIYFKALLHASVTILAALIPLFGFGHITNAEWINVAIMAVGSISVQIAPNVVGYKYVKAALAVLTACLTVAASAISGGISTAEWIQIALAGLGALGVYGTSPNAVTLRLPRKT